VQRRLLAPLVCGLAVGLLSCHPGAPKPNVILVLVDTLRADRLGAYGNQQGLTPFLDELAARGVVFKNVYANSSWTVPSIASLFTSRFPSQHHVTTFDSKLADGEVTLAERLQSAGYQTVGMQANFRLTRELGYAQGFATWNVVRGPVTKVRGDRIREATLWWMDRNATPASPQAPLFLYLHYMEPHSPYEPPSPFRERFGRTADGVDVASANALMRTINFRAFTPSMVDVLSSLYDGEVAAVDAELRTMFADLQQRGLLAGSVVVITADHGEEFKEHGRMAHGHALFNETLRVPLIVLAPGLPGGKVIENNVSLIDVAPTILALAGLPKQATFEGQSLLPMITAGSPVEWLRSLTSPPPDVISELPKTGSTMDIRAHSRALLRGPNKLVMELRGPDRTEVPEVFNLRDDPGEMSPQHPASDTLQVALQTRSEALAKRGAAVAETGVVDDATKEKLRALGYHF